MWGRYNINVCSIDGCGLTILPHPSLRHTYIHTFSTKPIRAATVPTPTLTPTYATPTLTPPLMHNARFGPYL